MDDKTTTLFSFRLEKKLKNDFDDFCRSNNTDPSKSLREFMKKMVVRQSLSFKKTERTVDIPKIVENPPVLIKMGNSQFEIAQEHGYTVDNSTNSLMMPFIRYKKALEVMDTMSEIDFKAFKMLKLSKPNTILSLNPIVASSFKNKGLSKNNLITQLLIDIIFIFNQSEVTKNSNNYFLFSIK